MHKKLGFSRLGVERCFIQGKNIKYGLLKMMMMSTFLLCEVVTFSINCRIILRRLDDPKQFAMNTHLHKLLNSIQRLLSLDVRNCIFEKKENTKFA